MAKHSFAWRVGSCFGLLLIGLSASGRADDPPPQTFDPPTLTFPDNRISLIDAVRLTLEHDPNLKLSREQSRFQKGVAQTASGQFDISLTGDASYDYTQQELLSSQKKAEASRRQDIQDTINELETNKNQALASLTDAQKLQADPTGFRVSDPQTQAQIDTYNRLIANTSDPALKAQYSKIRDDLIGAAVNAFQGLYQNLQGEEADEQSQLAKLGAIPSVDQHTLATLDLNLSAPLRNGLTPGLFTQGSYERDRYKGKPVDSDFGGEGIADLYKVTFGVSVDAMLLRGRGVDDTGAAERAARIDYDASVVAVKHAASTSVLNTINAYWNLAAAQESLEIAKQSAALQAKRVEVSRALVQGDELPRSEMARVLASQAADNGLVFSAERSVHEARIALARAMGLNVQNEVNAPLASELLPEPADPAALKAIDPTPLLDPAVVHRFDHQAAMLLQASGGVLLKAAILELRPQLNAHVEMSVNTLSQASFGHTDGNWAFPNGMISFQFSKPLGNNAAKGVVLQNDALLRQSTISATDLERTIKASVVSDLRSLQETADEVAQAKESVGLYRSTIDSENERFKAGQSTLIDAILTQDLQTDAMLTYASARAQYAILLAQLRFDTGTLVRDEAGASSVRKEDLLSPPSAEAGQAPR